MDSSGGEGVLRRAWIAALGGADVRDDDDFFDQGGDSLTAASVAVSMREHAGVALDAWWLYEHPRFSDAVSALRKLEARQAGLVAPIAVGPREGRHPLSFQQEGQLGLIARVHGGHRYQVAYAVAVPAGAVASGRLRAAVAVVGHRHPALRTGISRCGQHQWCQHVDDQVMELDVVGSARSCPLQAAREWADVQFLLDGQRLARLALVQGEQRDLLVLAADQMVMDPWSWELMLHELGVLYDDPDAGLAPPLAYSDYARWQREYLTGAVYQEHLQFWRQQATGYPPGGIALPGAPDQVAPAGPATVLPMAVEPAVAEALRTAARGLGTSLFHLLLALFQLAVARWAGLVDVLVGSATANRTLAGTRDVVGFFVNGRFTRMRLEQKTTVAEVVRHTRDAWRLADHHQELHLEKTVLDLEKPDLVNVKFSLNTVPVLGSPPAIGGLPVSRVRLAQVSTARRYVSVALVPAATGLAGTLTFRTDVLSAATAAALVEEYDHLLRQAARDPGAGIQLGRVTS